MTQYSLEPTTTPPLLAGVKAGSTVPRKGGRDDAQHSFVQSKRQVENSGITRVALETSNATCKKMRKTEV
jgi:hypothetical protein